MERSRNSSPEELSEMVKRRARARKLFEEVNKRGVDIVETASPIIYPMPPQYRKTSPK